MSERDKELLQTMESMMRSVLKEELDERFGAYDKKMDERFGAYDKKMDERFGAYDKKMDERFGAYDKKMDERFGAYDKKIDARFDEFATMVQKGFMEMKEDVSTLKERLEENTSTVKILSKVVSIHIDEIDSLRYEIKSNKVTIRDNAHIKEKFDMLKAQEERHHTKSTETITAVIDDIHTLKKHIGMPV